MGRTIRGKKTNRRNRYKNPKMQLMSVGKPECFILGMILWKAGSDQDIDDKEEFELRLFFCNCSKLWLGSSLWPQVQRVYKYPGKGNRSP